MAERFPSGPSTRPDPPFSLINSHPFGSARSSPGREAAKRTSPMSTSARRRSGPSHQSRHPVVGTFPASQRPVSGLTSPGWTLGIPPRS